ncbi:hypothetical protein D9756_000023 [Leucocoprinus leucothites]|uniref:Uncharacterized protein n=1 Tax=Leucocoprinus leucothites TaxID=201217 RepID=A0A8H5GFP0_9AGAR|nr:hypothetical protein D9756_000023 [Leucoagaricus leucothites]
MLTYFPQLVPSFDAACPVAGAPPNQHNPDTITQAPDAPRLNTIPLSDWPTPLAQANNINATDFYPVRLETLTVAQEIELSTITLVSPVHVHTPFEHIGIIRGNHDGEKITADDLVLFLHWFSQQPINRAVYAQLSTEMQVQVENAFMQRNGYTRAAVLGWIDFLQGRSAERGGLIGSDLLLGCTEVWGLEDTSLQSGVSVIHVV